MTKPAPNAPSDIAYWSWLLAVILIWADLIVDVVSWLNTRYQLRNCEGLRRDSSSELLHGTRKLYKFSLHSILTNASPMYHQLILI